MTKKKKTVAISILGTVLDKRGKKEKRWEKWRPTISICQHDDLKIDRMELLFHPSSQGLANQVSDDMQLVSPETEVRHHHLDFQDPWDFEMVYSALFDFTQQYSFLPEQEDYLIHITTGTHVAQICLYLLTETHYLPGLLIQTSPGQSANKLSENRARGRYQIIDLDLSKYDQIASRFSQKHIAGTTYLKSGIETRNKQFNLMIEQLEKVSIRSKDPVLLTGPTGAGKTQLARRIYALKRQREQFSGEMVVVNCATLRGDNAMSALFGHTKGAFTGATSPRPGLLKEADGGILFLDEIGELGIDEQAMLLRAIEEKTFLPLGSDKESSSHFQLIAGTNKNLHDMVEKGLFREDLLARINLWTYQLPALRERLEDFEPNLNYELKRFSKKAGYQLSINKAAKKRYLDFARTPQALWSANFRDLNSSVIRMATLSDGGRISEKIVEEEIERLKNNWHVRPRLSHQSMQLSEQFLSPEIAKTLDLYDHIQLTGIIKVCQTSESMADAGRKLFNFSRTQKKSINDSHRVKQILARYGLEFDDLKNIPLNLP